MIIEVIDCDFSICKVEDLTQVDLTDAFYFIGKTDEEISLVCSAAKVPQNSTACDHGWRAFRIQGNLDFSLIGILSKITTILAEKQIGLFAVSTYNTDYILVKAADFDKAIAALESYDYEVHR